MKALSLIAIMALVGTSGAVNLSSSGIFSKLEAEEREENAFAQEKQDAIDRKKKQLADAEAEHDKLVADEEKEEAQKKEEDEKKAEE